MLRVCIKRFSCKIICFSSSVGIYEKYIGAFIENTALTNLRYYQFARKTIFFRFVEIYDRFIVSFIKKCPFS